MDSIDWHDLVPFLGGWGEEDQVLIMFPGCVGLDCSMSTGILDQMSMGESSVDTMSLMSVCAGTQRTTSHNYSIDRTFLLLNCISYIYFLP